MEATLELAGKLYQSIETNHKALQATINQQNEEIRSLKLHIAALEAAAVERAEEQVANNRNIEQLERHAAEMSLQLSAQGDEITRVKKYNANFIAQYSAWNEWIEEQHAALTKIQSLLPSGNTAMAFMRDVRNQFGIKHTSANDGTPPSEQGSSSESQQDTIQAVAPEQDNARRDAHKDQDTINCAVFVPIDFDDASTSGAVPEVMPGQLPDVVQDTQPSVLSDALPDMQEAVPEIQPQNRSLTWPDVPSDIPEISQTLPETESETLPEPASEPFEVSLVVAYDPQSNTDGEGATEPTINTPKHLPSSGEQPQNTSPQIENQLSTPAPLSPLPTQTPNRSVDKPLSAKRRMLQRPSATGSDSEDDLTKGSDSFIGTPQRGGQHGGRGGQRGAKRRKTGKTPK